MKAQIVPHEEYPRGLPRTTVSGNFHIANYCVIAWYCASRLAREG